MDRAWRKDVIRADGNGNEACVCMGLVLFLLALLILFYNEFDFIFRENAIAYADTHVTPAGCHADPTLTGQLVYVSCPVTGLPPLKGSLAGTGLDGLMVGEAEGTDLLWEAQIYQWVKHEENNGKHDTVSWSREWVHNVGDLPANIAQKQHVVAATGTVLVGAGYYLSEGLRQQVTAEAPGPLFAEDTGRARRAY